MSVNYDIALASVIGSEHVRLGKNNQDALLVTRGAGYVFGVVSDGCGGCHRSEVGSALTVKLAALLIPDALCGITVEGVADRMKIVKKAMVRAIGRMVSEVSDDLMASVQGFDTNGGWNGFMTGDGAISSCFLATVVGFYACDEYVVVFSMGDGFYAINGVLAMVDEDYPSDNAPAYPAYNLMPDVMAKYASGSLEFAVKTFPAKDVETIMVGTDGVRFLCDSENVKVPGKSHNVGKISQLWDDKMFLNHDMLRRTLSMLNKDVHLPDWQGQSMIVCPAILKDDTTVISAKKR